MSKNSRSAYIFAFLTIVFWSTVASAFKIALHELFFLQLLWVANITSFITLLFILLFNGKFRFIFYFSVREYMWSAFLGFLNPFLYYVILFKAYSLLPAQIAQPLNFIWPIVLVLLSVPILGQKLTAKSFAGLLISFVGVIVISSQGNIKNFHIDEPFGVFLALASAIIWALFWIFNMRDKRDDILKLFLNFFFSGIYITATCLFFHVPHFTISTGFYMGIYVGLFEMGITFVLWLKALQLSESTARISNLIYITPFLSLVLIRFILKEHIFLTSVAGLVLIIVGIIIQKLNSK
jgi:drug/metabolite transporter (DMT)-like permease